MKLFGVLNVDCVCIFPCLQILDGSMSACEEGDKCYDQASYCKEDDKYVEYGNSYKDRDSYIGQEQVHG